MAVDRAEVLLSLDPAERRDALERLSLREKRTLHWHWPLWAHEGQLPPKAGWDVWLLMAGRGFGKTRAGAEWVRAIAENDPDARIALVGASLVEARQVMVEGPSGLLRIAPRGSRPRFEPSKRRLTWDNGAQATLYSAGEPESLRGPQQSHAWCDEIAKWSLGGRNGETAWDNLLLGLRLGSRPQVVATTTPRTVPLVQRILAHPGVVVTGGSTETNKRALAPGFLRSIRREFRGSMLARQELDGELIGEVEGALWTRALLERCREEVPTAQRVRTVVGVDPPAGGASGLGVDACGIVVAALLDDGNAVVLADASVEKASPERWARAAANAARAWRADRVVAEANQGGAMVRSVLRAADEVMPVTLVHASRGKVARAEPVAALYEAGKVRHAGIFAKLEDEMCGLMAAGRYEGPGRSPDRADALVWALTELMLGKRAGPRIRVPV